MASWRIFPAPTGWGITKSGRRVHTSGTKAAARNYVDRNGRRGDSVQIQREDGTIQTNKTLR